MKYQKYKIIRRKGPENISNNYTSNNCYYCIMCNIRHNNNEIPRVSTKTNQL